MTSEEKAFETLTKTMMTMYNQALKNKRQLTRLKVAHGFLGELIEELNKNTTKCKDVKHVKHGVV